MPPESISSQTATIQKPINVPPPISQTSTQTPTPSNNSAPSDSFSTNPIEQYKQFLREGVNMDSKTVQNFLTENGLTNDPRIKEIKEKKVKDLEKLHQYVLDGFDQGHNLVQELLSNSTLSPREISHAINTATIKRETGELFSEKSLTLHAVCLNPLGMMLGGPLVTTIHDVPKGWNIGTSALSEGWSWLTE